MTRSDKTQTRPAAGIPPLTLGFGLAFEDLYTREGLLKVDAEFQKCLRAVDPALLARLLEARARPEALDRRAESQLLVELAPAVDAFVAALFGIRADADALLDQHVRLAPVYECRRQFVQKKAAHQISPERAAELDGPTLGAALAELLGGSFSELAFATQVLEWQKEPERYAAELKVALEYAAWAVHTPQGRRCHRGSVLFRLPEKVEPHKLVPVETQEREGVAVHGLNGGSIRRREGFALTDHGADLQAALAEVHYCIGCHEQGRDSCSRGLTEKAPGEGTRFRRNVFGTPLIGCPLEEKISEFHVVKSRGLAIAALAMITVDNPMAAATGHRICNDCMKACIYQKQQPVNIPESETRALKDVLALPWGFEIYSLLTRWNPLNLRRPLPKARTGKRVLVVGMGPAGFTVAHHLMNDGHTVVGIDGLKIEPLPPELSGVTARGERVAFRPIRDVRELYEKLDSRITAGFGGVAEYGITVRWDKNFLKLVRLLLERREQFTLIGGVRFGGTLTLDDAFEQGFDHVVLAMGAGRPTVLDIPNGLARGVRTASDFLMALQLTGAAKSDSIANLQLRLPVVVIGGGLTAIDAATESLAYYPLQVEKFLARYEALVAEEGEAALRAAWSDEEREIAEEFLAHARALRAEREAARADKREPRILELLQSWGGVTIAYRKRLIDSPAYTLNHEEVSKALEEGVRFAEAVAPKAIETDRYGHAAAVRFERRRRTDDGAWVSAGEVVFAARTVLVAAGTQPNTVLAREDSAHFNLDGGYFQACDEEGHPVEPARGCAKPREARVLCSRRADGRFVSFLGDLHPSYFGNVVKAMASAKQGYPLISRVLERVAPASSLSDAEFTRRLNETLRPTVQQVARLTPDIVEVTIRAPAAARRFRPGQFFRLQNFETLAPRAAGTRLAMEGLALTGASVDPQQGLVSLIVLEMGGSADLCAHLKPGEPVVLMGPTGTPTEIPVGETVALVGGGLGNAVLFSIGQALRAAGCRVLYFAGYKRRVDRYKVAQIEAAADAVVWCCDEAPGFMPGRPQDRSFVGNLVEAMAAYGRGDLGEPPIPLSAVERMIVIGSDRMMAAVAAARHGVLRPFLNPGHLAIGSINSPMQCMLKEICGQCLQQHTDPGTGEVHYVFSCFNQDQPLDRVDFECLAGRLRQNAVQEKLTARWLRRCTAGRAANTA